MPQKEVELAACTGVFAISPQFAITVTQENGKLVIQATNQGKVQLEREAGNKFTCIGVDAKITFMHDAAGKVNQLILHQNGKDHPATRQGAVKPERRANGRRSRSTRKCSNPTSAITRLRHSS